MYTEQKRRFFTAVLFFLGLASSYAQQDLFDSSATRRYVKFLMETEDYKTALAEWERLYFMQPHNDSLALNILQTYQLAGAYTQGAARFQRLYPRLGEAPRPQARTYLALLRRDGQLDSAYQVAQQYPFAPRYGQKQQLSLLLLRARYQEARNLPARQKIKDPALLSLVDRSAAIPRKSPFLSGLLSGLVPGLGKAYTGQWKDGLFSLVFVGANAFGAYRGFTQRGAQSALGWIAAGIGTAFYAGNIYGSVKAAQQYNHLQEEAYHQDVESYLRTLD